MATRNEKEQIISNRIYRQKQYDERRQLDYEQALEREHANALHAQFEYKQQTEMQLLQHFEILANKKANQHDKNVNNCRVLVNQLLNFSFKISEYRELNDKNEVPLKILRQWKTLFLNEQPLESKCDLEIEQDSIIVPDSDTKISDSNAINSSIQILDDDEFSSYIEGSSDWIFPKEMYLSFNLELKR